VSSQSSEAPRCVALIGPYLSGKTTLFESLLFATGATHRKGSVKDGTSVGDSAPEARARQMSTELSAAAAEYLGDSWTLLDCPGSIEFVQEAKTAVMAADAAVVVCEPTPDKALTAAPILKFLDRHKIPHMLFINKMDTATARVRDVLQAFQGISDRPLVLRQVPIQEGDTITGYVDLVSERAYNYRPGEASDLIAIPEPVKDVEQEARTEMLEFLADYDDKLLEQLLEDVVPSKEEIYGNLTKDLRRDLIVPVFLGAAEHDHGTRRLLKALRHEVPSHEATLARMGVEAPAGPMMTVFKTYHAPHTGKLSLSRIWAGEVSDGMTLAGERVSGLYRLMGSHQTKLASAGAGDVVALGRMDEAKTGDVLTPSGRSEIEFPSAEPPMPVFSNAVSAEKRSDEVKLMGALTKLIEEDPSLAVEQNADTHELLLWGQGEIHLQNAIDRLGSKFNLAATMRPPQLPYKETIRKSTSQHGRYKRQTGGHGQFGDVHVDIKPLPRGTGFSFSDTVVGGAVPKQYIPAVGAGVREYMNRGPLGFPVVDIEVTLTDGQYHSVDSSEQAFKMAARIAMTEGMPSCDPVLLEPIFRVTMNVPSEFTPKLQRVISSRRGQILGFGPKEDWSGWDEMTGYLPQAEMRDLIVEIRSLTLGVGTFAWGFDHLQELTGKHAEQVVASRAEQAAAS
jgi:elongation factor G